MKHDAFGEHLPAPIFGDDLCQPQGFRFYPHLSFAQVVFTRNERHALRGAAGVNRSAGHPPTIAASMWMME